VDTYEKLKILADSAKFDVSCSSSGASRHGQKGKLGSAAMEGICHTWSSDGRCVSLLKVLYSNKCVYDCKYCVNRRSVECPRASFEPDELARLTMEFYKRNYIEGLFLSSAVEVSPDYTAERILHCLRLLREKYGFYGYIHAKIIPGVSQEIVHALGMVADRLSVNIELPTQESLAKFAPQKKPKAIFTPMRQITNTLIEHHGLKAPGRMFKDQDINSRSHYIGSGSVFGTASQVGKGSANMMDFAQNSAGFNSKQLASVRAGGKQKFAPAGQTTQMIIGAGGETDRQIIKTSESLYNLFKMKRVYFSAYIPVSDAPDLPDRFTPPPLAREHRLYQADWLLRFYGFTADEIIDEKHPFLDTDLDPKVSWALRHIEFFPIEINRASIEELLRIPGVGTVSAYRILRQRRVCAVKYEDLKKMGVVLKRAKYFLTCSGKYYGGISGIKEPEPEQIRQALTFADGGEQISMFGMGLIKTATASTMASMSSMSTMSMNHEGQLKGEKINERLYL